MDYLIVVTAVHLRLVALRTVLAAVGVFARTVEVARPVSARSAIASAVSATSAAARIGIASARLFPFFVTLTTTAATSFFRMIFPFFNSNEFVKSVFMKN